MSKGTSSSSPADSNWGEDENDMVRRGPWTLEEDNLLIQYITSHGEGRWNFLAKSAGLKRSGKSCRLRWLNYLKPDIKRGNLSPHEQILILELHAKLGNRWSKIAQHLPGRTDNEIKNYWRTRVQKQARQLNVDSNSDKFLQSIRQLLMPITNHETICSFPPSSSMEFEAHQNSTSSLLLPQLAPSSSLHNYSSNPIPNTQYSTIPCLDEHCYSEMQDIFFPERRIAEIDWFGADTEESFRNSDELWQFRKMV